MDPSNRQAPTFDDSPPERLSERGYRLRARLGGGRLGAIYEAQDELSRNSGSQHFVAILLIDSRIASQAGFAADFEHGAAELKSISHPNIVKLLEYGCDQNRFYLVNEMLESASLRFVLNDASTLPAAETTAVLRAVGDALQYLHAKNLVHGNLRPENVLVTFGYEVKLLDIVPNGWLVNPNDALGVPARAPDKRDDVFGLACLAYEMLSGRHPFNGNTAQEAYRSGMEAERLDSLGDRDWRALANALAVHRDDRTPSVSQFLDEFGVGSGQKLKSVVATGGESAPVRETPRPASDAPRPTYTAPEPPPSLARPVIAERAMRGRPERRGILGTLAALLLLIGLGVAVWYYQEPLRAFSTDLMSEVETRIDAERAPAAKSPAPAPESAQAPLESAPAVTDPEPAMVLAPGAKVPADANARASADDGPVSAPPEEPVAAPAQPAAPPPAVVEPSPGVVEQAPAAVAPAPAPSTPVATAPTRFSFQQDIVTVREGDVAARITIRRSGDLSGTASVSWWTEQGTARADADYADLGARIERFEPGEASRTIFVPLTNDAVREPVKTFHVLIGRGEVADDAAMVRVDITDDD